MDTKIQTKSACWQDWVVSPYMCDNMKKLCTSGSMEFLAKKEVHVCIIWGLISIKSIKKFIFVYSTEVIRDVLAHTVLIIFSLYLEVLLLPTQFQLFHYNLFSSNNYELFA